MDNKPIGVALNRNLGSPVAPGEAVEAEARQAHNPSPRRPRELRPDARRRAIRAD